MNNLQQENKERENIIEEYKELLIDNTNIWQNILWVNILSPDQFYTYRESDKEVEIASKKNDTPLSIIKKINNEQEIITSNYTWKTYITYFIVDEEKKCTTDFKYLPSHLSTNIGCLLTKPKYILPPQDIQTDIFVLDRSNLQSFIQKETQHVYVLISLEEAERGKTYTFSQE